MGLFNSDKSQVLKSIDWVVPVLLTGAIGYFAFTRLKDWRVIAIIVVVVFMMSYLLTTQVTKVIDTERKRPDQVPVPDDKPGTSDTSFDATGMVQRIFTDIDGWALFKGHDAALWKEVALLSNANLVKIYNAWNKLYFDTNKETLTEAIDDESFLDLWDLKANSDSVINRLRNLGLN